MDEIIKHIIEKVGDSAVQQAVLGALTGLALAGKKVLSLREKRQLEEAAEKMVQVATLDDLDQLEPVYREMERIRSSGPKKGVAYKKAAPKKAAALKKRWAPKKAADVVRKRAAPKKVAIKRAAKKAAAKR